MTCSEDIKTLNFHLLLLPPVNESKQKHKTSHRLHNTWGVQVVRYPNFFSGMEADRNVKVVGGDVAVL